MRYFITLSIWILLGTLAGYGFLNLIGLDKKNDYSTKVFNFEKSASSVVNIWSLRRWREWQEKTPSLGLRRWKQVIKTGFFPDGSGVIFDNYGHIITNLHVLNNLPKPASIISPTYPILITYELSTSQIYHYDLYRVKNLKELEELEFFENLNNNITFIEWPEMLINLPLNKKHYLINLDMISETKRKIKISFNQ